MKTKIVVLNGSKLTRVWTGAEWIITKREDAPFAQR